MTQELIDKLSKQVSDSTNAREAAAWADALRHVMTAIGIQYNLNAVKSRSLQPHQGQTCQD